jgi:hypothetical protein
VNKTYCQGSKLSLLQNLLILICKMWIIKNNFVGFLWRFNNSKCIKYIEDGLCTMSNCCVYFHYYYKDKFSKFCYDSKIVIPTVSQSQYRCITVLKYEVLFASGWNYVGTEAPTNFPWRSESQHDISKSLKNLINEINKSWKYGANDEKRNKITLWLWVHLSSFLKREIKISFSGNEKEDAFTGK